MRKRFFNTSYWLLNTNLSYEYSFGVRLKVVGLNAFIVSYGLSRLYLGNLRAKAVLLLLFSLFNLIYGTKKTEYFQKFSSFTQQELKLVQAERVDFNTFDASSITGLVKDTDENIMKALYKKHASLISKEYALDFYTQDQLTIEIKRDPCRGQTEQQCEGKSALQDFQTISAGNDFQIAFKTSSSIVRCSQDWERLINCGTFIEIHRPFNPEIIEQKRVEIYYSIQYEYMFFSSKKLCAGQYEIWYVVRSRVGTALQQIKPFYVDSPNCTCDFQLYLGC